jgi:hypothetical protein
MIPLVYNVSFGDRDVALAMARDFVRELDDLESVGEQFRGAINVGVALSFLGALNECYSVWKAYYEKARASGLAAWEWDFCCCMCTFYLHDENFEQAEIWHERSQRCAPNAVGASPTYRSITNGFELAIWKRDAGLASERLNEICLGGLNGSVRMKSYLRGAQIRWQQLDPRFDCDDDSLRELLALYDAAKRLTCADCIAIAVGEALRRRRMLEQAQNLLRGYVDTHRRERSPVPPSLRQLLERCSEESAPRLT